MQFLPIAPEVEDPEDSTPVTPSGRDSPPAKKAKYKSYDIHLEGPSNGKIKTILIAFLFLYDNCA